MQIAHEAPLKIMKSVQALTDYDYCLVHLLEESEEYLNFFLNAKQRGRKIIMDCSLFELGHAFDPQKYYDWLKKIQPDEYIVPDVWQDTASNIKSFKDFNEAFDLSALSGIKIGVLQGKTFEDFVECYQFMDSVADKIAISFGYDFYLENYFEDALKEVSINNPEDAFNQEIIDNLIKPTAFCIGRINLIDELISNKVINVFKKHHLLGCGLPVEFAHYRHHSEEYNFIESLDTSHPILSGFFGHSYSTKEAISQKVPQKMVDVFEENVSEDQYLMILNNIRLFRDQCF